MFGSLERRFWDGVYLVGGSVFMEHILVYLQFACWVMTYLGSTSDSRSMNSYFAALGVRDIFMTGPVKH